MDSYDIRKLRGFISEKEAAMKADQDAVNLWTGAEVSADDRIAKTYAAGMRKWHSGRVSALAAVLVDLKELFAEELKEGE